MVTSFATSPLKAIVFVPTTAPFQEMVTTVEKDLLADAAGRPTVTVPAEKLETAVSSVGDAAA